MSIQEKVEGYKKTLALFPNPQEKYQYLIEQAKKRCYGRQVCNGRRRHKRRNRN